MWSWESVLQLLHLIDGAVDLASSLKLQNLFTQIYSNNVDRALPLPITLCGHIASIICVIWHSKLSRLYRKYKNNPTAVQSQNVLGSLGSFAVHALRESQDYTLCDFSASFLFADLRSCCRTGVHVMFGVGSRLVDASLLLFC